MSSNDDNRESEVVVLDATTANSTTNNTRYTDKNNRAIPMTDDDKELIKKKKYAQIAKWAKGVTKDHIETSPDGKSIISIKGMSTSDKGKLGVKALLCIARSLGIVVSRAQYRRENILKIILQHTVTAEAREDLIATGLQSKRTNNSVHPQFIQQEGTIYRIILSLTCEEGKLYYSQIGAQLSRSQLDSKCGHSDA